MQDELECLAVHGFLQSVFDVDEDARLDTEFSLNVVGTTPLDTLVVSGTITAEAAGTAGKSHQLHFVYSPIFSLCRELRL